VNRKISKILAKRKQKISRRLQRKNWEDQANPMLQAGNISYQVDGRHQAIASGGIGAIHLMNNKLGFVKAIDQCLHLLKCHLPYHESDHVLNIAYNVLAGGTRLEDIDLQRQDEAWLNALGAEIIPDPTTSGDFLRRFGQDDIIALMEATNQIRKKLWQRQPKAFLKMAIINIDGTLTHISGECKQGIDISYKGIWGYAPLIISLSHTREALYLINRPGNAPSHLDSAQWIDRSLALTADCFEEVRLRGDTDFSLTEHLDRWDRKCKFVFGMDARSNLIALADGIDEEQWQPLERWPKYEVATKPRSRRENVKDRIVKERGFKKITTVSEDVSEFAYRPVKCKKTYRMVVVRKNLTVEKGELALFDDIRYFFYITNDDDMTPEQIVYFANERCDHENDIEQLKNGVNALRMPVNDLLSNWAYMVIAALAWSMKAWYGLCTANRALGRQIIRMEFKRFLNTFIKIPCIIVKTGRRIVYRILAYNSHLKEFFRTFAALRAQPFG
jgi:Transposase DDE domain group 1